MVYKRSVGLTLMLPLKRKPYGRGGKREEQREATKTALLDATERLFASSDARSVTVTDIAKEAGVSTSLINVYFAGKDGLLYALVTRHNEPQNEPARRIVAGKAKPRKKLDALIRHYTEADLRNPLLLAAMQSYSWVWPNETEAHNRAVRAEHERLIETVIREGIESGDFRPDIDVARSVTSIWAIYTWGLRPGVFEGKTPAECADQIIKQVGDLLDG
ncbi:MAG: TetR/AcrR family transcriptional regulator [Bauldia sp.]|nr:TetR/AcrR family transcriptional regulator [Bauldia sp.]